MIPKNLQVSLLPVRSAYIIKESSWFAMYSLSIALCVTNALLYQEDVMPLRLVQ